MAIIELPVGRDAPITLEALEGSFTGKTITFEFHRKDAAAGAPPLATQAGVVVSATKARCVWKATGPEAGREVSCTVVYDVRVGEQVLPGAEELEVYHDWLEVTAQTDEEPAVKLARERLRVVGGGGRYEEEHLTGPDGKLRLEGLPPGARSVTFLQATTCDWGVTDPASGALECMATLTKPPAQVVLDWPRTSTGVHRQYVNFARADLRAAEHDTPLERYDSELTLRIKRRSGAARTPVYVGVEFNGDNVLRQEGRGEPLRHEDLDSPWEALEDAPNTFRGEFELDEGEESLEVKLDLGLHGGDRVTVSVGTTKECADDRGLVIENWRRVFYTEPASKPLPAEVKELMERSFALVFVELVCVGTLDLPRDDDLLRGLTGAAVRPMLDLHWTAPPAGADARTFSCLRTDGRDGSAYLSGLADERPDDLKGVPAERLRRLFVVDLLYERTKQVYKVQKAASEYPVTIPLVPAKLRVLQTPIDTEDADAKFCEVDAWNKTSEEPATRVPRVRATAAADGKSFVLSLRPGPLPTDQIKVKATCIAVEPYSGSSPDRLVTIGLQKPSVANMAATLIHELGHSLGAVPRDPPSDQRGRTFPELDDENALFVWDKGFAGSHCLHGIDEAVRARTADFRALHDGGTIGTCVMWGAARRPHQEPDRSVTEFCPTCVSYFRALTLRDREDWPPKPEDAE